MIEFVVWWFAVVCRLCRWSMPCRAVPRQASRKILRFRFAEIETKRTSTARKDPREGNTQLRPGDRSIDRSMGD